MYSGDLIVNANNKLCVWRHNMSPPSPPSVGAEAPPSASRCRTHRNVAVVSCVEYVPTLTAAAALRVKAALSKAAW